MIRLGIRRSRTLSKSRQASTHQLILSKRRYPHSRNRVTRAPDFDVVPGCNDARLACVGPENQLESRVPLLPPSVVGQLALHPVDQWAHKCYYILEFASFTLAMLVSCTDCLTFIDWPSELLASNPLIPPRIPVEIMDFVSLELILNDVVRVFAQRPAPAPAAVAAPSPHRTLWVGQPAMFSA